MFLVKVVQERFEGKWDKGAILIFLAVLVPVKALVDGFFADLPHYLSKLVQIPIVLGKLLKFIHSYILGTIGIKYLKNADYVLSFKSELTLLEQFVEFSHI